MKAFSVAWWQRVCVLLFAVQLLVAIIGAAPTPYAGRDNEITEHADASIAAKRDFLWPDPAPPHFKHKPPINSAAIRLETRDVSPKSAVSPEIQPEVPASRTDRLRAWAWKQRAASIRAAFKQKMARIRSSFSRLRSSASWGRSKNNVAIATVASTPAHLSESDEEQNKHFVEQPVKPEQKPLPKPVVIANPMEPLPNRQWLPHKFTEAYIAETQKKKIEAATSGGSSPSHAADAPASDSHLKELKHSESFYSAKADLSPILFSPPRPSLPTKEGHVHGSDAAIAAMNQKESASTADSSARSSSVSSTSDENLTGRKRRPGSTEDALSDGTTGHAVSDGKELDEPRTIPRPEWRKFVTTKVASELAKSADTVAETFKDVKHLVRRDDPIVFQGYFPGEYIRVHHFAPRRGPAQYHFVHVNALGDASRSAPWSDLRRDFKTNILQVIPNARRLANGQGTPDTLGIRIADAMDLNGPQYTYPGRGPVHITVVERNGEHILRLFEPRTRNFLGEVAHRNAPEHFTSWLFRQNPNIGRYLMRRDFPFDLEGKSNGQKKRQDGAASLYKRDPEVVWKNWYSGEYISIREGSIPNNYVFQFEPPLGVYSRVQALHWNEMTPEQQRMVSLAVGDVKAMISGQKTPQQLRIQLTSSFYQSDGRGYMYPGRGSRYITALDYGNGNIVFEQRVGPTSTPFKTSGYDQLQSFMKAYVAKVNPELVPKIRPPPRFLLRGNRRPTVEAGSSSSSANVPARAAELRQRVPIAPALPPAQTSRSVDDNLPKEVMYPGEKLLITKDDDQNFRIYHTYAGEPVNQNRDNSIPYRILQGDLKDAVDTVAPALKRLAKGKKVKEGSFLIAKHPNDADFSYDYPDRPSEWIRLVDNHGKPGFLRTNMWNMTPMTGVFSFDELPDHIKSYLMTREGLFTRAAEKMAAHT